jgi:diaminopimelate epimerase
MQAVGNDFVVVEERQWPEGIDWAKAAIRLCDRNFGIGADGFIVVGPSEAADVRMRFFNPDGTPDMCGNGLRCVAELAYQRGMLTPDAEGSYTLQSPAGEHLARRSPDEPTWFITMGAPRFAPWEVPVIVDGDEAINYNLTVGGREFTASSVSTGSAHTVLFVDAFPDDEMFLSLSPLIENDPLFPERTSVMWAYPDPNAKGGDGYLIRIWERGVGETLGCGTGACAVGVVARRTGRTDAPMVVVASRGGGLAVRWSPEEAGGTMLLIGPAQVVYSGTVAYDAQG